MKVWIDTEFNGFQGDLISMALVSEDGHEWYESLGCENPTAWVMENVMPVIGKKPVTKKKAQSSLKRFLQQWQAVHIIADWPEDIAHFCQFLIVDAEFSMPTPHLTFEIREDIFFESAIPHNALEDARAICLASRYFG